jgi:deazaflavin-dependent oxidoreductase (nitroreductase family)
VPPTLPPNVKDSIARVVTVMHRTAFEASKGRVLGRVAGMPVLVLHTTGRKSGKRRSTMLTSPLRDGDAIVLVASYGGDDRHPTWYLNLRDNPDVEVTMDGGTRPYRARVATEEERERLWPRVVSGYRGYGQYQTLTERTIPLVVLEPR